LNELEKALGAPEPEGPSYHECVAAWRTHYTADHLPEDLRDLAEVAAAKLAALPPYPENEAEERFIAGRSPGRENEFLLMHRQTWGRRVPEAAEVTCRYVTWIAAGRPGSEGGDELGPRPAGDG
jgi:hypothetical protein